MVWAGDYQILVEKKNLVKTKKDVVRCECYTSVFLGNMKDPG